jgi:hypothetical protein
MKIRFGLLCVLGVTAGTSVPASAAIVFSNISVGGTLSAGWSNLTGLNYIDFILPNALVGDSTDPLRSGTLSITFDVTGTAGEQLNKDILSLLGGVEGSGVIRFSERVDDLTVGNQGTIATLALTIDTTNPPPRFADIVFSRATSKLRVTKTFDIEAKDATAGPDTANVSLVEQVFVPTPGAIGLAALTGLAGLRRRR